MRPALAVATAALTACGVGGGRDPSTRTTGGAPPGATASTSAVVDTARADSGRVEVIPVSQGVRGMRTTVRWVLSPDRRALLVVADGVSVEADPWPNSFLYASERTGGVVQVDDVWDVAPSPDWTRLAFGRAFVLRAGERDTVPPEEWRRLEAWLPEDVADRDARRLRRTLEAHTFPVSGMSLMLGLGVTQVLWVDRLGQGRAAAPTGPSHSLHGWRVRWTPGGDTLGVGAAPRSVADDAPPSRWVLVRPRRWAHYSDTLGGTTDESRFARVEWVGGATMELGSPIEARPEGPLRIDGGTIEEHGGVIRFTRRGANGRAETRVVGPGLPFVATAGGQFIAAIVDRRDPEPHGMRAEIVVYHVRSR